MIFLPPGHECIKSEDLISILPPSSVTLSFDRKNFEKNIRLHLKNRYPLSDAN